MASLDTTNEVESAVDQTPAPPAADEGEISAASASHALSPLSGPSKAESLSDVDKAKASQILAACRDRDLEALRELAASENGLIEDDIRRTACKSCSEL